MEQTKNTAFTLVELIVVITILAVLATVAFISFQGYTSSSRDSVRLADLKNISKSFEFMKTKDQELPFPDQKVDISNSGTIFQYQGVLEEQTLKLSNIHNGGLDPLTGDPYGYAVNSQRNKFQLIGFLENSQTAENNLLSQSLADNSDKFLKTSGQDLGILLDTSTNQVLTQSSGVNNVDIQSPSSSYKIAKNNTAQEFTSQELEYEFVNTINTQASCKAILESGNSQGDGMYMINPTGESEFEVYCDMKSHGGGWTLVWEGLPSQALRNLTLHENVALSGSIVFNEIYADAFNTTDYHIEKTTKTSVLDQTIRQYYSEVKSKPNTPNPSVEFHDVLGTRTSSVSNMMYGYGNGFRVFAAGRNPADSTFLYMCSSYNATQFTKVEQSIREELNGTGSTGCYSLNANDFSTTASNGLSIAAWQQMKVYVR